MSDRRRWAWPLVPLYAGAVAAKDTLRAAGILPTHSLQRPVISIGSLAAGGSGKTPVVIALTELLQSRGWQPDILSRGYGRSGHGIAHVDPNTEDPAHRFGDEPVLIAQRTGAHVWVGANRFQAGLAAEAEVSSDNIRRIHLLDDGFQHRALGRTMDIVVVTAEDLDDALLPAGNRRERLTALRRADAIVLREEELAATTARIASLIRPGTPIWPLRRSIEFAAELTNTPVIAFCGIARPAGFFHALLAKKIRIAESIAYPDHSRYTVEEMHKLVAICRSAAARAFVTTEKDAVKLTPPLRAILEAAAPARVARMQAAFLAPEDVMYAVEARMEATLA